MMRLLLRLWNDDGGAVVSVELVLIISILIFGLIPGLVSLRNSGISFMATLGNLANALIPSFTFSGYSILVGTPPSQTTLLQVNGVTFNPTPVNLSGMEIPPVPINIDIIPPAP